MSGMGAHIRRRLMPAAAAVLVPAVLLGAAAARGEVVQKDGLRVAVSGKLSPSALPRAGAAPVSVSVGGRISALGGRPLPQLEVLRIEINRHGRLDYQGLPTCAPDRIEPATTAQALAACRPALVGQGTFSAEIVLKGQAPYPTTGRLLVFNARIGADQVLLGQIYTEAPFVNSFVIPFRISSLPKGTYGTALTASLPEALGDWGYVTGIEMTLSRRYPYHGRSHSYLSAGCPAPKGFPGATFPLARTTFSFAGGTKIASTLVRSCRVRP